MTDSLPTTLTKLREQRGFSKSRLSREAGISDAYVVQIEKGDRLSPSEEVLRRLAHALRVPAHYLLVPAGHYPPAVVASAEESADLNMTRVLARRDASELPDDLRDRFLSTEYDEYDWRLTATEDDYADEQEDQMRLPAEVYWGWNRPLPVIPPEHWDSLDPTDKRLVQKLINRLHNSAESGD